MMGSELFPLLGDWLSDVTSGVISRDKHKSRIKNRIKKTNSVRQQSKDLILQYPMLISSNISMETSQLITRALEHEYANLLILILNSKIAELADGGDDIGDYLKNYHTNYGYTGPMDHDNDYDEITSNESVKVNELIQANIELNTPINESMNNKNLNALSFPNSILKESTLINESEVNYNTREIKKLNDMSPTIVTVSSEFIATTTPSGEKLKKEQLITKTYKFGVKGVIHPLQPEDISNYLASSVKDKFKLFRFIQWTTGEIKFFRDLIADTSNLKKQALDNANDSKFWWRKLKSLSQDHRIRALSPDWFKRNDGNKPPIPTATIIISKSDVDAIKMKHGIDILNNSANTYRILKDFFLLGFVIIDEATEMAYVYNESTRVYDYYNFNSLKDFAKKNEVKADLTKGLIR